ncbi:hypothetical protein KPL39_01995 [Clostridium gasigenes]|uniref:hypothetical protein n=1 Tax=Clostridium gasigenes TaxID=94869 RepID=UPI001C0D77DC|nr:hypothetical protein [Clostridium gasigenes]MBU3135032.1 hypothetical protein [Clostridium gasigenes]
MTLNNYTIQNLEERNAIMKGYSTNPITMKDFEDTILKCSEQGWNLIMKRVLENLWKQNLQECQVNRFMEQINKDGFRRTKFNIKTYIEFYKNYFELGFTSYIAE